MVEVKLALFVDDPLLSALAACKNSRDSLSWGSSLSSANTSISGKLTE